MKKFLPLLFVIGACAPDITQNPAPSGNFVIAQFDPGNVNGALVPTPTDLALITGHISVPPTNGCQDLTDPANPKPVVAKNAPATSSNKVKDADETDVDCGGTSTNACDADKACLVDTDCASQVCTGGKCVGGCPSAAQQELNNRYLATLTGFPYESTASCSFSAEIDPGSVSALDVLGIDITDPANPVAAPLAPTPGPRSIVIPPPTGGWTRGHHYAVVLLAGDGTGIRGKNGERVMGSQTWALVSSHNPLITCADLKNPSAATCQLNVDIIPSTQTDPNARLNEQIGLAAQLEQIRQGYDQILSGLEAKNITTRDNVPLLWTFQIVDAGEVTFDPANQIVPFPNDILRDVASDTDTKLGNVKLPIPTGASDLQKALIGGLNTLDGFSTAAPLISENGDKTGAVAQATIDKASLTQKSVGLAKLKSLAPKGEQTDPQWVPCLNCESTPDATGKPQTSPQELQWSFPAPLDERTTYLAYVTTDVKDDKGKNVVAAPTFALLRSSNPLVDAAGKSTVSLITSDQAAQLEPLRAAMKPALDNLEKGGVKRENLTLAFVFTTQSESTVLDQIKVLPQAAHITANLPDAPVVFVDAAALYPAIPGVHFFAGAILSPELVTGQFGTFNPDPTKAKVEPVQFVIAVPTGGAPPATGFPVTIFGHGFRGSRNDGLAVMAALANGTATGGNPQVVIATDKLFHGERTSCTDSKTVTAAALPAGVTPSDAFACADPTTMDCDEGTVQGLCILRAGTRNACTYGDPASDLACTGAGQGRCAADGKCQGAGADLKRDPTTKDPVLSGWNYFSLTNFFTTRDNFRQEVIDLQQVVQVIKSASGTPPFPSLNNDLKTALGIAGSAPAIDKTKINYVGQSMGAIDGTLFTAVSPDVQNVVLNVNGGKLRDLLLLSPSLAAQRTGLLATLQGQGLTIGTPAFDQFVNIAQWIIDEADPFNMAYRVTHPVDVNGVSAPPPTRKAFLQFIQKDQFVVNETNIHVMQGANRQFTNTPPTFNCTGNLSCYMFIEAGDPSRSIPAFDETSFPLKDRHAFLTRTPDNTSVEGQIVGIGQAQVAKFIGTGTGP